MPRMRYSAQWAAPACTDAAERALILLGLGDNVDYEVIWDENLLQGRVSALGITRADLAQADIVDQRSLLASLCQFMATGQGGERQVASSLVDSFLDGFRWSTTIGGTAPRAAIAMAKVGVGGTLHLTTMNDTVRALLPASYDYVCSNQDDHVYPHLIMQYPPGASIRLADGYRIETRVANRLIYVNDPDAETMGIAPAFPAMVARARLILLSGLNVMSPGPLLSRRLGSINQALDGAAPDAVTVLEEAGYHEAETGRLVRARLSHRMTVHSMNSEEFTEMAGRKALPGDPAQLAGDVRAVHAGLGARNIVVHSPGWALAYGPDAPSLLPALDLGMRLATLRYAVGDGWVAEGLATLDHTPRSEDGVRLAAWARSHLGSGLAVAAGWDVSVSSPTTIGLGDTFVAGLMAGLAKSVKRK